MAGGRPTDYNEEILAKANDYLTNRPDDEVVHTVAGLAVHLHISRETVYDWAKQDDKKEFSDIVVEILSNQERALVNKGLKGEFNSTIAKLLLAKHGYKEESDITTGGNAIFTWQKDKPEP